MAVDKLNPKDLKEGLKLDFGPISFSEEEIIDFAKRFDPLPFHIDKAAAKKSIFGRLVASGPQLFVVAHKRCCLPVIGHTILAGLEIDNWLFIKPVFPDMPVFLAVKIIKMKINKAKQRAVIVWEYLFKDSEDELVQSLKVTALHKIA